MLRITDITDMVSTNLRYFSGIKQVRRRMGGQANARHIGPEAVQPDGQPTPLESRMSGDKHPFPGPKGGIDAAHHSQTLQGALWLAHNSSS